MQGLRPRAVCALLLIAAAGVPGQQKLLLNERGQREIHQILHDAWHDVATRYYDPSLHGLDWDARYREYDARVSTLPSLHAGFALVAEFLSGLSDSHTYFGPPAYAVVSEAGFRYAVIGDSCFITQVLPGSDADHQMSLGDQLIRINGAPVTRYNYEAVTYELNFIAPQTVFHLDLRTPSGELRHVTVHARILRADQRQLDPWQAKPLLPDLTDKEGVEFWRVPDFFLSQDAIDQALDLARRHSTLVLDLRGNTGGSAEMVSCLVGGLFDHEVTIGQRIGRSGTRPLTARPHRHPFLGRLVVLVDNGSRSGAEIVARVVQIEHRGIVIGDRTAGTVMIARSYIHSNLAFAYGFSISEAKLLMTDGHSLEQVGVMPDELVLPSAEDLADRRDPALARAAELSGLRMDAVEAAQLWPPAPLLESTSGGTLSSRRNEQLGDWAATGLREMQAAGSWRANEP